MDVHDWRREGVRREGVRREGWDGREVRKRAYTAHQEGLDKLMCTKYQFKSWSMEACK